MSHSIKGNDITLTRGDTLFLQLSLTKDGEPYTPEEGSSIRFAMKSSYDDPDEDVVLLKDVPMDTLLLEFEPDDTKPLPLRSKYVYDIQLTDEYGHVETFISGKFKVDNEVI